jgi:hypothetical protein
MSDMSHPSSLPHAADHEHHDRLLVAQLAAGDALEPRQSAEAEHLVTSCAACAALVSDLRTVSAIVAQEPIPPRRRHFILSPEQAQELAGNRVTRFLRRLSLPTARAFQPAAAGVLSIGLLFLVAGYAWPTGGALTVPAEPNLVTRDGSTSDSGPGEVPLASVLAEQGLPAPATAAARAPDGLDSEFFENLPKHQAGTSERTSQKSLASEADTSAEADTGASGALPAASPADDTLTFAAQSTDADTLALRDTAADEATDELEAVVAAEVSEPEATAAGAAATTDSGTQELRHETGPEDLLIVLGLVLALAGGGLLLLGWLARHSKDPLLP